METWMIVVIVGVAVVIAAAIAWLVTAKVMTRLAEVFAHERSKLEEQWASQKEVGTEDLRVLLQRYRSFFDRLLGVRAPGGA